MEKKMENEMENGFAKKGIIGTRFPQIRGILYNGESNGKEHGK